MFIRVCFFVQVNVNRLVVLTDPQACTFFGESRALFTLPVIEL